MYKNRTLATYEITYLCNNFVQIKYLVSRDDWENIIKPIRRIIATIESDKKESKEVSLLKQSLNLMFIDHNVCFPENSPLSNTIKTGILSLPQTQGGEHKVKMKRK